MGHRCICVQNAKGKMQDEDQQTNKSYPLLLFPTVSYLTVILCLQPINAEEVGGMHTRLAEC